MSSLTVYDIHHPDVPLKVLTHLEDIASTLGEHHVRFERWEPAVALQPGASPEDVLNAYRNPVDRLKAETGYGSVDVLSVDKDHPGKDELRAKFRREHRHGEDVLRFFVLGRGQYYLHIGDQVYVVLCEKHDLIGIPAGTRYWLDMGENPYFMVVRVFNNAEDWPANDTHEPIADRFPALED